ISVCLGTDSLASNSTLNLFDEMRTVRRTHPHVPVEELVDMVTRRPAKAIGLGGKLGEITPGAHADLIAIPFAGPSAGAREAVVANWTPITWSMVDGRVS